MQIQAINNQNYKPQFTSKVIIAPNTATRLSHFMQDNPPVAKSIMSGLKDLEKNGNNDIVMIENGHTDIGTFVLWVFEKAKNKLLRSETSYPIDFSLYTFKSNVKLAYEKAKNNMINIENINQSGFEAFNPLK
jgi:hypothetical protein